jgi:hypothetical protein
MWDGHSLSSGKFYSEINATKFLSDYELYDYLINFDVRTRYFTVPLAQTILSLRLG